MGVPGLWNLLEPARHSLELDALTGRIIAIDMNIWLHQAVKSRGASNSSKGYLGILFRRLCKLIFFGIRPVFVFDGEVPALKRATMAARRRLRSHLGSRAERAQNMMLRRLLRRLAESATLPGTAGDVKSGHSDVSKRTTKAKEELLKRLAQLPDIQQAKEDEEVFSEPPKATSVQPTSQYLLEENAGMEFDELARDFLDGYNLYVQPNDSSLPPLDLNSSTLLALPLGAQLRVVQLAREQLDSRYRYNGGISFPNHAEATGTEAFSMNQVNRLLLRRRLAERQQELSVQIAKEDAARQFAKLNDPALTAALNSQLESIKTTQGEGHSVSTSALRIQSRDTGHVLLIKKSPIKFASTGDKGLSLDKLIIRASDSVTYTEDQAIPISESPVGGTSESKLSDEASPESPDSFISIEDSLTPCDSASKEVASQDILTSDNSRATVVLSSPDGSLSNFETDFESRDSGGVTAHAKLIATGEENKCLETLYDEKRIAEGENIQKEAEEYHKQVHDENQEPKQDEKTEEKTHEDLIVVSDMEESEALAKVLSSDNVQPTVDESMKPKQDVETEEEEETDEDLIDVSDMEESEALAKVLSSDNVQPSVDESIKPGESLSELTHIDWTAATDDDDDALLYVTDETLREQADRLTRQAQNTTTKCIEEAQELLRLFGVPFIVSPEEAEAQCIALQRTGAVELVASDDSDVWPFGARTVCRHLFGSGGVKKSAQQRLPSTYQLEDVQRSVGLNVANILRLTLLCGSDYTPGVQNVGPVTAMEILSEFGQLDEAVDCEWLNWLNGTQASDSLIDQVLEPLERFADWWKTAYGTGEPKLSEITGIRKKWNNLIPPSGFPDRRIVQAYLHPNVTMAKQNFSWRTPDSKALSKHAVTHLGWRPDQTDAMLKTILNRQEQRSMGNLSSMARITDYYPAVEPEHSRDNAPDALSVPSKRVRAAIKRLTVNVITPEEQEESNLFNEALCQLPGRGRKRKPTQAKGGRKAKRPSRRQVVDRVALSDEDDD